MSNPTDFNNLEQNELISALLQPLTNDPSLQGNNYLEQVFACLTVSSVKDKISETREQFLSKNQNKNSNTIF